MPSWINIKYRTDSGSYISLTYSSDGRNWTCSDNSRFYGVLYAQD